jgi:Flp pilus assembly protein TadG
MTLACRPVRRWNIREVRKVREAGSVMVEFALILPLLIMLAIPVFYVVWNIIAQTVITNAAREMVNLAARPVGYNSGISMQEKMDAVAATTPPLRIAQYGNIYVTQITADSSCSGSACPGTVTRKWRWNAGSISALPRPDWGACQGSWAVDGQCDRPSTPFIALPYGYPGKQVFVAEVYYQLPRWAGLPFLNIPGLNGEPLYAWAIF